MKSPPAATSRAEATREKVLADLKALYHPKSDYPENWNRFEGSIKAEDAVSQAIRFLEASPTSTNSDGGELAAELERVEEKLRKRADKSDGFDAITMKVSADWISNIKTALAESRKTKEAEIRVPEARTELTGLRLILAADLGNIKPPVVSRTKREILEETIDRIETILTLLTPAPTSGEEQ